MPTVSKKAMGMQSLFSGHAAQDALASILKTWQWTLASPAPDLGIDFIAQPPSADASPIAPISVQVKHKSTNSRKITLRHAAVLHLRRQALSAFLFVVHTQRRLVYWVYLEPLFSNSIRPGADFHVKIVEEQRFRFTCTKCPRELWGAVEQANRRTAMRANPRLSQHANELTRLYKEIDPRFHVRPLLTSRGELIRIEAAQEPVNFTATLLKPSEGSASQVADLLDWGSPLKMRGELRFTGSRLFDVLCPAGTSGHLRAESASTWKGKATLRLKSGLSISGACRISTGRKGAEIRVSSRSSAFVGRFRIAGQSGVPIQAQADFFVHVHKLPETGSHWPRIVRFASALLQQVELGGVELIFELIDHPKIADPFSIRHGEAERIERGEDLKTLIAFEALADVLQRLSIDPRSIPPSIPSRAEVSMWPVVRSALQGSTKLHRASFQTILEVEPAFAQAKFTDESQLVIHTDLPVTLQGRLLTSVPVVLQPRGYEYHFTSSPDGVVVAAKPKDEQSVIEIWSRTRSPELDLANEPQAT